MKKSGARLALAAALVLLAACAATFRNHGFVPRDDQLAAVQIGADTRESLIGKIGGPATDGLQREDAWYYVESRFRHGPFRAPEEIERRVLRITFDSAGRVANIERFGIERGRVVRLSARVTETVAADQGFLRALFRNLGQGDAGALLN